MTRFAGHAAAVRAGPVQVLHESVTTRVFRRWDAGVGIIYKQPVGADARRRLHHESSMLSRLAGIRGVPQIASGTHPDGVLAMQDCGGMALSRLLRAGALEQDTLFDIAVRLVETLAALHRAGVIHCNINPGNIIVSSTAQPMLIDFALARIVDATPQVADAAGIAGALAYVAPEQTGRTGRTVDRRADLYSVGVTLYEMATGRLPFQANDTLQVIHDHLVREPMAPSELDARVPPVLSHIVMKLLAKAPEQRYQGAEGLLHDLRRARDALRQADPQVFELGERDFPARLSAPQRLVGRDAELAVLHEAFADALHSPVRTVLVEGPAGVGKSALVHALKPTVAAAGGWFVHGKFDQYQRDAATSGAVTQALRALASLLLAQPKDDIVRWRGNILRALGPKRAGLLASVLPDFAILLGERPQSSDMDPFQAESQLHQVIVDLLVAIVSPRRPLVIMLDDLQWAGPTSLKYFESLMLETRLSGVLLVGTYRAADVGADHALAPMLAQWSGHAQAPTQIALANLGECELGELTGEMLRLDRERTQDFASAVRTLTGGNPFDTVEIVNVLREEGVLRLDEHGWQWDEAQVRRFVGRSNVMDLLAARIARLPAPSRELLECMSCIGSSVGEKLMRAAAGLDDKHLRETLLAPLDDGLLLAEEAEGQRMVRFRHDRVQHAVLAAMDTERRAAHQLAMARRLAAEPAFEGVAARHYLECVANIEVPDEQRRAARLFYALACKLAGAARYALVERYLAPANALLAAVADPDDAPLRWSVDVAHHAALYSLGRLEDADPLYARLRHQATGPLELVEPACLQMRSLDMRGNSDDAMNLGLGLLGDLGVDIPRDFAAAQMQRHLDALAEWVRLDAQIDHSTRPRIEDPRLLAIAKLLGRTVRSAVVRKQRSDEHAIVWLLLQAQRLWAEHGPCRELVATLGSLGGMLVALRQDYRCAFDLASHVLTVGEALHYEPQTSEARFLFVTYACHWLRPVEEMYSHATRAFEGTRAAGDLSHAAYVNIARISALLDIAANLDAVGVEVDAGIAMCERTGNVHAAIHHRVARQAVRMLGAGADFDDEALLAHIGDSPWVGTIYHVPRAVCALVMGDLDALAEHAPLTLKLSRRGGMMGYYKFVNAHLSIAMVRAWQLQADPAAANASALLVELDACRDWLSERAADQPYNFLHLELLVNAERAWALSDFWTAAACFDSALLESRTRQRPWHRALIAERAGLFHLSRGLVHTGRQLLTDARDQYRAWGAAAKVKRMQDEHAFLREPVAALSPADPIQAGGTGRFSHEALDLMGVLRASQVLSSETSVQRLAARVTEVLAALTGASKVLLLSCTEDEWSLLTPASGEASILPVDAAESGLLPMSVFTYAERTRERLLVQDAVDDDRFSYDTYFANVPVCSVLVVPIGGQHGTRAMLYLENRHGRAAFGAQRLDALMLIAGQLAVSLANAQLYEGLEQRVLARTRELEETQARLVATARRAGKAEIANSVLHNVGNVLNTVTVSAFEVRRTISRSRSNGVVRAVALVKQHEHELGNFIQTERGQALFAYFVDAANDLQAESKSALEDMDRLLRSVDRIGQVMSSQGSDAGSATMRETVQTDDMLQEALRQGSDVIARANVNAVVRNDAPPAMSLDSSRILQILAVLITNAVQAMESVPHGERRLTLAADVVPDEEPSLRITLQDTGEGILPENLVRIFAHGFTTRDGGHGFGLHSAALAATEMGGRLHAHSDGLGKGAAFTLELPLGSAS
jgi:predicted ATPase/signal transduction histidine kinase/predicted Ser/Thr protein kinase